MKGTTSVILIMLENYLKKNPDIRFGQALFNLNITEFANKEDPQKENHLLRDIYYDEDDRILTRMTDL